VKNLVAIGALALAAMAGSANATLIGGFNSDIDPTNNNWINFSADRVTSAPLDGFAVFPTEGARFLRFNELTSTRCVASLLAGDVITFDYFVPAGGFLVFDAFPGQENLVSFGSTGGQWATATWTVPLSTTFPAASFEIIAGTTSVGLDNVRLNVPAPGAGALLGLGSLMVSRRRRP
jgi:hypothetical protein